VLKYAIYTKRVYHVIWRDDLTHDLSNTPPSGRNERKERREKKNKSGKRNRETQNITMTAERRERQWFGKDISRHIRCGNPRSRE
jgi:hypothetical protein